MVTLRLVQIDSIHVHTGDVLCDAEDVVRNVSTFSAKILTFEHVMPMFIEVHRGRMHASGKISKLVATLDRSTGKISKKSPRIIPPGNAARVQIELELPMPLEATWKIILRAEGRSVAAGIVE
jgi:elongation factor 1 alpha-like protein